MTPDDLYKTILRTLTQVRNTRASAITVHSAENLHTTDVVLDDMARNVALAVIGLLEKQFSVVVPTPVQAERLRADQLVEPQERSREMKYQTRMIEVDAVQWTARNLDEVRTICPDAYATDSGWTLAIPIPQERRIEGMPDHLVAHVGYYVVRTKAGMCVPMVSTQFENAYELLTSRE